MTDIICEPASPPSTPGVTVADVVEVHRRFGQTPSPAPVEKCSECDNPRIGIGVFAEFCRPCVNRPCGNCGDEGHAKWECVLPAPVESKPKPFHECGPECYATPPAADTAKPSPEKP